MQQVKVWVWVIIYKWDKVLLWKRKNSHWENTWSFPGWHLEFWESFEECAQRETLEEVWINIKNFKNFWTTNDIFSEENKHYVTIFISCEYEKWEVQLLEPEKCLEWKWFDKNNLPENLFLPIKNLLKEKRNFL